MYDNIGGKLKALAKAVFAIEAITAIIAGIVLISLNESLVPLSIFVMFFGPIIAWISSWFLYGFGQLIENSDTIAEQYRRENEKYEKAVSKTEERKRNQNYKKAKAVIANPSVDDEELVDINCPVCKEMLSYTKEQLKSGENLICPLCNAEIRF